jgi:hypothetical protein
MVQNIENLAPGAAAKRLQSFDFRRPHKLFSMPDHIIINTLQMLVYKIHVLVPPNNLFFITT